MIGFVIVLLALPIGLYLVTMTGEHYVSNPRIFRWGMVTVSALIAMALFGLTDDSEGLIAGVAAGLSIYVFIYIFGTVAPFLRPGMREAMEYPDNSDKKGKKKKS